MNTSIGHRPNHGFTIAAVLTLPWIAFFATIAFIWHAV
jgi:hypothetical protein